MAGGGLPPHDKSRCVIPTEEGRGTGAIACPVAGDSTLGVFQLQRGAAGSESCKHFSYDHVPWMMGSLNGYQVMTSEYHSQKKNAVKAGSTAELVASKRARMANRPPA